MSIIEVSLILLWTPTQNQVFFLQREFDFQLVAEVAHWFGCASNQKILKVSTAYHKKLESIIHNRAKVVMRFH